MTARPTRSRYSVKTLDSVRATLQERYRATMSNGGRGGWRAVAAEFKISTAMAHLIATKGHEPQSPAIRAALGLSRYKPAPVCSECGEVHTTRYCTQRRKQSTPTKPRIRWKRHYLALAALFAADMVARSIHSQATQVAALALKEITNE